MTTAICIEPADIKGLPAGLHCDGVYSPSVCSYKNKHFMFLGVSIGCQNNTVRRDSIAWATSDDGVKWQYKALLAEPNPGVSTTPISAWPVGTLYQVNDPSALVIGQYAYVVYTSVFFKFPFADKEAGCLGIAIYDLASGAPVQIYRNDSYLVPTDPALHPYGFSRPVWEKSPTAHNVLWFDSAAVVHKIAVTNVNQLVAANVQATGLSGVLDIDVSNKPDGYEVLANGASGVVKLKYLNGAWVNQGAVTSLSAIPTQLDRDGHGSPDKKVVLGQERIYFAGIRLNAAKTDYISITIMVAL